MSAPDPKDRLYSFGSSTVRTSFSGMCFGKETLTPWDTSVPNLDFTDSATRVWKLDASRLASRLMYATKRSVTKPSQRTAAASNDDSATIFLVASDSIEDCNS